jgi:DNA-binding sugar fermentation-stimulating protein
MRQETVLLGAVEAVNLVDEKQRPFPHAPAFRCPVKHLAEVSDAREHGGDLLKVEV